MATRSKSRIYCAGERPIGRGYVETKLRLFNQLVQLMFKNKSRLKKERFVAPDYCGFPTDFVEQLYPDTLMLLLEHQKEIANCKNAEDVRLKLVELLLGEFGT
jgi:hypothetical protein